MLKYKVGIEPCKTKLFKAVMPENTDQALKIANDKGFTSEYISKYFDAKPVQFQVIYVFSKPFAFKIINKGGKL